MHSLSELKDFLESKEVKVKSYNGYQLVVGKSKWGLLYDVFYCDSNPVPKKEILKQAQKCIQEDKGTGRTNIKKIMSARHSS